MGSRISVEWLFPVKVDYPFHDIIASQLPNAENTI